MIPGFVALCSFVTLVPLTTSVTPLGGSEAVGIANILAQTYTGVSGMFTGLVVGITATELFLVISKIKALRIKMPESVPPMVAKSFDNMIPFMLVVVFYAVLSFVLDCFFGQSFNELVVNIIQQPIKGLTTSLPGFLIAMAIFNLLFAIGIHPSAIVDTVIGPGLLLAITENMDMPENLIPYLHRGNPLGLPTWLSRFDFVLDDRRQLRMVEINADTPCFLIESYYANGVAARYFDKVDPNIDAYNELERFLKRVYEGTSRKKYSVTNKHHNMMADNEIEPFVFGCFHDYLEDYGTTQFLLHAMKSACPEADIRFLSFYDMVI
mgnify:CR=1 FL=1